MKTQILARGLVAGAALMLVSAPAQAQTSIALGGTTYEQDFNTLASSGTGSTVPAGWAFRETGSSANTTYATTSSNAGNTYSFGTGSDRALGSITSGSVSAVTFGAFFTNNLGATIESLTLDYFGEQWRLGTAARDVLSFEYSTDATSLTNGTWTAFSLLDFANLKVGTGNNTSVALDGNDAANRAQIVATIAGLAIADGGHFAFRWTDRDVTGSDQGLAIDDLKLTAGLTPPTAVPEPAAWGMMIGGFALAGSALRRRRRMGAAFA